MGAIESSQFADHQSMEYRLPWISTPAADFHQNEKYENPPTSALFAESKVFPAVFSNDISGKQSASKNSNTSEQSEIFQNIINENLLKNNQKFNSSNFNSRKNKRKNWKRNGSNQPLRQVVNNSSTPNMTHELRSQGYQFWNHVPNMNWTQSNVRNIPIKTNFQNPLRPASVNKVAENPFRIQYSTRSFTRGKFTNTSSNSSSSTIASRAAPVPKINFKSNNMANKYSGKRVEIGNAVSRNSSKLNNSKKTSAMGRNIGSQINSSSTIAASLPSINFQSNNMANKYYGKRVDIGSAVSPNSSTLNNSEKTSAKGRYIKSQINSNASSRNVVNMKESKKEDDDITYLFTVDSSSEKQIVLEVDLQSETTNLIPNKSAIEVVDLTKNLKTDNVNASTLSAIARSESTAHSIKKERKRKKRKLSNGDNPTSKRTNNEPKCTACLTGYENLNRRNVSMYISRSCSHIFCHHCISKGGSLKVCPACGIEFLSLRRLFI